jgi:hypothetical protein
MYKAVMVNKCGMYVPGLVVMSSDGETLIFQKEIICVIAIENFAAICPLA